MTISLSWFSESLTQSLFFIFPSACVYACTLTFSAGEKRKQAFNYFLYKFDDPVHFPNGNDLELLLDPFSRVKQTSILYFTEILPPCITREQEMHLHCSVNKKKNRICKRMNLYLCIYTYLSVAERYTIAWLWSVLRYRWNNAPRRTDTPSGLLWKGYEELWVTTDEYRSTPHNTVASYPKCNNSWLIKNRWEQRFLKQYDPSLSFFLLWLSSRLERHKKARLLFFPFEMSKLWLVNMQCCKPRLGEISNEMGKIKSCGQKYESL